MINRRNVLTLLGSLPAVTLPAAAAAASAGVVSPEAAGPGGLRQRTAIDAGWKFRLGDAHEPDRDFGFGALQRTYAKQGVGVSYVASPDFTDIQWGKTNFDDSGWQNVILPHDWAVSLPFTPNDRFKATGPKSEDPRNGHGFKPLGREYPATSIGWYRYRFDLSQADMGKRLTLEFDGIFRDALIMVNGYILARNESGYAPFSVDFTDVANPDGHNLITIRVDATLGEGWFYEGAGIYRRVHLVKTASLHVPQWGVLIRGRADGRVEIATQLRQADDKAVDAVVVSTLLDPDGKVVASQRSSTTALSPWGEATVPQTLNVASPRLWDVHRPELYTLRTAVEVDGVVVDQTENRFGLRDIRFDADRGFFLNGRPVKLRGANLHQDHAGVGCAVTKELNRFRLERMVEMGCNAVRCSHNPQSAEFMDLCDEMGLLVIAENRQMISSEAGLDQLKRLVLRDRNRPSVILWSIGNEEPQEGSVRSARVARTMIRAVRRLDPTRLVGAAFDNSFTKPQALASALDFVGVNYNPNELVKVHETFPKTIVIASETGSSVGTRGVYVGDEKRRHVRAYDNEKVPWGQFAHEWLPDIENKPYVAGGFVWTGLDYHGEPSPFYTFPSVGSQFGVYDSCGFPKDTAYYMRAWWRLDEPLVHLLPHWNWVGREGQPIDVWCYSNLDEVELRLNGKSLGRKTVEKFGYSTWQVPFAAGKLEARGYRQGRLIASSVRETAGAPAALRLSAVRDRLKTDGQDTAIVRVSTVDSAGRPVPTAELPVRFALDGPLWLAGTGNGDPSSLQIETEPTRQLFSGLCQVILRTRPGQAGKARLVAEADGVRPAQLDFTLG
ncbi:beta-galactosidase GalA [Caulobacter sp. BE254]|uniref:beta-galactosidase GalA n=1 Tax=Caulobacter sp. BE254 TaxID=2817720 RepID=UPI00285DFF4A|nr:beta-galactosidase GalA [Caulobacter sp. BE254]MDR7114706.1 beta-galactosidase [Caulobacter sp. BE254]